VSTAESKRIKDLDHEIRELKRANEILKRAPSSFGAEFDRQLSGADTRSFKLNQVRLPWSSTGSPSCTSAGPQSRSCSAMPSSLAEEWTDRFLAAATLATTEHQALQCISPDNVVEATDLDPGRPDASPAPPKSARWTHSIGLSVPDRGRLRPAIWRAWPGRSMGFVRSSGL
jgi:hypothetical protein